MGERRLTAAWVRYQDGCNLISLLVIRAIPFRFLCLVRILLCFLFPSSSELHLHSSYLGFRVYLSGLHNNALGLRELRHDLVCITIPFVCVKLRHDLVCITMPFVCVKLRHGLV